MKRVFIGSVMYCSVLLFLLHESCTHDSVIHQGFPRATFVPQDDTASRSRPILPMELTLQNGG